MGEFKGPIAIENEWDGDDEQWRILKTLSYTTNGVVIKVKKDAVTDGASVPRLLTNLIPKIADPQILAAAIIHDLLYRTQGAGNFTRSQSDKIFRQSLKDAGEHSWKAWILWAGVRIGGRRAWKSGDLAKNGKYIEVVK